MLSFLDHPPLIAWFVRFGTALFGDTNFGVRFPGLLSMLVMQLLLADIVWRVVRDWRYVIAVVLMTEAAPDYGLMMAKIAPDTALIPCELADDLVAGAAGAIGRSALVASGRIVRRPGADGQIHRDPARPRDPRLRAGAGLAQAAACEPVFRGSRCARPAGVLAPVLYWNATHDWASFKFQLDRPPQVAGWSARFVADFLGQQFALVGILLLPIACSARSMLAVRGYRNREPIAILLSTAVILPLLFFLQRSLFRRASATAGRCWSGRSPLPASRST